VGRTVDLCFSSGQTLAPEPRQVYRRIAICNGEPTIEVVAEEGTRKLGGWSCDVTMSRADWRCRSVRASCSSLRGDLWQRGRQGGPGGGKEGGLRGETSGEPWRLWGWVPPWFPPA
jgi:hypothetical protein